MTESLDALGILNGTDKSSLNHGYLRHYDRILGHLRSEPITLLEIGVFRGASLKMWSDYLHNGLIVGVDIDPKCAAYAGPRREVEIGSQADAEFLEELGRRRKPHVIIDDGSHHADHVLSTFRVLFPHLQPGGIYIIEDIHFHAGAGAASRRGSSSVAPQDVLLRIARLVSCPETEGDDERDFARRTDSVEFVYGAVAIRKRPNFDHAELEVRRRLVERVNQPRSWSSLALHVYNNTGDLDIAVDYVLRAIALAPDNPEHFEILSIIRERASDIKGAITATEQAFQLNPLDKRLEARAISLRRRM